MVLLSLPAYLRHRIGNVYLAGVVPGPSKPSLDQINKLLTHLVDDLESLWLTGAIFKTPSCPGGLHVRCALIPLVCDMPAAHEVAGFSSYNSSHFCRICLLTLSDIDNIDVNSWPLRSFDNHIVEALKWRDAADEAERAEIVDTHGLRYSVLLRLSYWNAVLFTVIDSMHALLLGLLETHCRTLWGMSDKSEDFDGVRQPHRAENDPTNSHLSPEHQSVLEAMASLESRVKTSTSPEDKARKVLQKINLESLKDLCRKASVSFDGTKRHLWESLKKWQGLTGPARKAVLGKSTLTTIWSDQKTITTPSWLGRAPKFAGSTSHGKLKADEWRNLCSISLVYSLTKLWSNSEERYQQMLENFMHLITMINMSHLRIIDHETIELYRSSTLAYLAGVKTLFREQTLVPNHHAALHLPDLLKRFGPVHAWRTFAFERYNGIMQSLNHNSRIGVCLL
ncbi:hypothetical protein SISNIDRAFT_417016 [Sistotremastrum niveocremeum HHB9708]|uniref:SAP domain-containing protein n=1 Tax=Sistotremastrum niveocremeum HHB9708 TaxID=1314777 RepID=A0A164Q820_9AGAM|nr:hypothetical protein SISNIDRAFT_417016 [Sistotremastrum niveocremeum HHB9708]